MTQATATSEICFLPAAEMARRIARKELSAREVMAAHLRQLERVNPRVNAIVTLVAEQAMEEAQRADELLARGRIAGPLHGLPVAHKDLHDTRGIRTTYGSALFRENVPAQNAILVERLKAAGAITIGKTNTPEFGAGSQTFNAVFGATRNPYDPSKTCGGSSGGSAVALACGMMPIGDGSDTGGSLRNPAAFCNVVGLRPAPGRVPRHARGLAWSTLNVDGPMARTVADVALLLSVMAGPDARDPIAIAEPGGRFAGGLERDFEDVRVAWAGGLDGVPFAPEVRSVVDERRNIFEDLGCVVEDGQPDFRDADEVFRTLRAWSFHTKYGELVGRHRDSVKDTVVEEVERGARLTGPDLGRAETLHAELFLRAQLFFEKYEYLVLPVTQVAPFDIDQPYVAEINGIRMETYIDWMKSCYYISMLGHPAISVPCGFTADGLPVGIQIVGRHEGEWSVLQLAHAFEQGTQMWKRRPAL
ncbi:MAG TPA: amidase [Bryobacteraceae bacterium]|nr:amidase [Bryobacteraceae bacterium]